LKLPEYPSGSLEFLNLVSGKERKWWAGGDRGRGEGSRGKRGGGEREKEISKLVKYINFMSNNLDLTAMHN